MLRSTRFLFFAAVAAVPGIGAAQPPPETPGSRGFAHFYKCPSDRDVDQLGDTVTAGACLAACEARRNVTGCWWLDGTGGFPRQCRVCRTMPPSKGYWPNDWALPMTGSYTS